MTPPVCFSGAGTAAVPSARAKPGHTFIKKRISSRTSSFLVCSFLRPQDGIKYNGGAFGALRNIYRAAILPEPDAGTVNAQSVSLCAVYRRGPPPRPILQNQKSGRGLGDILAEDNGRGESTELRADAHLIHPFGAPDPAQAALCSSGKRVLKR